MTTAAPPTFGAWPEQLGGGEYSVSGTDDRFQIRARTTHPSTLRFPFNTVCFLEADTGSGFSHRGTGTLIAPQVVLTAKHVLTGMPRIRVTPGADLSAPARLRRPATPNAIVVTSARFRSDPGLDYGVMILPRPFRTPGRFMMLQPRGAQNTATLLHIAGYPCDKPRGTVWGHTDRIELTGVGPNTLRYRIDTCPGHSGSPIWLLGANGVRLLLGVHTNGTGGPASRCPNALGGQCLPTGAPVTSSPGLNSGVRVTCRVIRFIQRACREFGVRGPVVDAAAMRRTCTAP